VWWETLSGLLKVGPREHWAILKQDCGYAARMMRKNPGFTLLAILTLGLGIGANTAIFSAVHAILLKPLPYPEGNQLVVVRQAASGQGLQDISFSVKEVNDYRAQNKTLAGLEEYHTMTFTLLGREEPLRVQTGVVSAGFFDLFGVRPILGRSFRPEDDRVGAPAVLLVSYEFWKNSLGGDPEIVGKTFRMNDRVHTVIGVLPPVPQYPNENDVYMPTSACPFRSSEHMRDDRDSRMMNVFGRKRDGITAAQVNADLATIAGRLKQDYPKSYPAAMGYGTTELSLQNELTKQARPTLLILLAAAGFVLLIACANVANLMLARMSQREREMAVRTALGAGQSRILRQLLTESVLIAILGAVVGVLFASGSLQVLTGFASRFTPRAREIRLDYVVLLFALIAAIGTSVFFGSISAFFSRETVATGLKEGPGGVWSSRSRHRLRSVLIISQVAFSFLLLAGAGLMLRSFIRLTKVNPGFVAQNVLAMDINANFSKYTKPEQYAGLAQRLLESVKTEPGVLSAAISSSFPFDPDSVMFGPQFGTFDIENRPLKDGEVQPVTTFRAVSPDYFRTLGIPLLSGRAFTDLDSREAPKVAIINQALAKHRWPSEDAIGHRLSVDSGMNWMTIVGVVGNTKELGLDRPADDQLYVALDQFPSVGSLVVRSSGDPLALGRDLRQRIYEVDSDTAITNMQTIEHARGATLTSPRLTADLMGIFAGLALVMAATGIGGIMALTVSQRIREIGIRMALGARPSSVLKMILGQGLALGLIGIAIGVFSTLALTRLLRTMLFEISPTDPATLMSVTALLITVAISSCVIPAWRAATIDPLGALRFE
jgi:putative ABC transport system permease protein